MVYDIEWRIACELLVHSEVTSWSLQFFSNAVVFWVVCSNWLSPSCLHLGIGSKNWVDSTSVSTLRTV